MTTQTPPIQTQQSFRPVRIREGSSDPDFPPIRIAVSSPDPPDCIDHHLAVQRQQSSLSDQQCSRPSNKIPEDKQDLRATKGGIQKIKADQQRSQPSNKIPEDKQDLSATKGGIQKIKNVPERGLAIDDKDHSSDAKKRGSESLDNPNEGRPLKRQCLAVTKDDLDRLREEVHDVKICIGEIKLDIEALCEHLRGDVDLKMKEIIHRIRQLA